MLRPLAPTEHGEPGEAALVDRLPEEHARRLVAHADVDADLLPLALQHLLHQLADAAAGGGHELELQRLALGVVPDAALQLGPAGGVEQRGGLGGVVRSEEHTSELQSLM